MKRIFFLLCVTLAGSICTAFAQVDSLTTDTLEHLPEDFVNSVEQGNDVWDIVIGVAVLLFFLAIFGHMVYELFIRPKYKPLTMEEVKLARQEAGLGVMKEAEANDLLNEMSNAVETWTSYTDESGEEMVVMTKYSQTKQTKAALDKVLDAKPDNEDVIDQYNKLVEMYNGSMSRHYSASTKYIIITGIVAIIMCFSTLKVLWLFVPNIILYIMSSMKPRYLIDKQTLKGDSGSGFMSGVIGGILGLAAAAPVYTTVTKWSDGTTTREDDHSAIGVSFLITILLLCIFAFFMFVIAIINYLRNYILHI